LLKQVTGMDEEKLIEMISAAVVRVLKEESQGGAPRESAGAGAEPAAEDLTVLTDLTSPEYKQKLTVPDAENDLALRAMKGATTARVGIGRAGLRQTTKAMLAFRADFAMAKDAVMKPVDEAFLRKLGLPTLLTKCSDINVHLTRPDLGRQLSEEALRFLHEECIQNPQIQIYVSDGLSNSAIEHNAADLLPVLMDGLKEQGVKTGTPFFVKYGRVPTMDAVSEAVGAEVTCVLIGERPGLAAADSMSAYITYGAHTGIPESSRTVVSNIHKNGIQPVEAGAYLVDLLLRILSEKKSGVDLKL
jgi:ethanolamine ammonia-lyase small subunit